MANLARPRQPNPAALFRAPHLEWVLITAVESLPHPQASSPQVSDDRGVITCWVTPAGMFKTVVAVLREEKSPLYAALETAGWPFPDHVTTAGIEHCLSLAQEEPCDALITTWSFQYPDEEEHLIKKVAVSTRHSRLAEKGVEAFAHSIAVKVGWLASDSGRKKLDDCKLRSWRARSLRALSASNR